MRKSFVFKAALITTLITVSAPVQAQTATVQEALFGCKVVLSLGVQGIETVDQAIGVSSCMAVVDTVTTMLAYGCHSSTIGYAPLYSASPPSSTGAAVQTFVNWAEANPQMWGENAVDGVIAAIMETFTCEEVN